jgi:putative ABC transport system substrate-binding protein
MRSRRRPALGAAATLFVLLGVCSTASARPSVAVVTSSSIGPFEQATTALVSGMRRSALQPEILTFDMEGRQENTAAVLLRVRAANPSLVVTVGSLATAAVLAEPWPIPVVFCMVLYPAQSGFVGGGRAVTGASLDLPLETQFATLRRLLPNARRVGVLYHVAETGRIVDAARGVASRHGFSLEARSVDTPGDALRILDELLETVDAMWTVADSHVFTPQTTSEFILSTLRRRTPVFGLSAAQVRTGALVALSCDYADVGSQAAELALRALQGEKAADIPPTSPRKIALGLNLRTAQYIGVHVPPEIESEATEIVR